MVFPYVKAARKAPDMVAREIGDKLCEEVGFITGYNVVKGYLNLSISNDFWSGYLGEHFQEDAYGLFPVREESPILIAKVDAISRYLNETNRTKADFDDLMESGDLKSDGILLFMVTGAYYHGGQAEELMFLVQPDKKTLHTLDPFGDNLLYREDS